jgi:transcriptional regulator with XRE-family HTH domain
MTLGQLIRRRRLDAGLTQQELADRAVLKDVGTISRIERDHHPPRDSTLSAIAAALGVDLAEFRAAAQSLPEEAKAQAQHGKVLPGLKAGQHPLHRLNDWQPHRDDWLGPRVLTGAQEIARALLELIALAAETGPPADNPRMILTSQAGVDVLNLLHGYREDWPGLALAALYGGWDIAHLVRSPDQRLRVLPFVTGNPYLLMAEGKYKPYYFHDEAHPIAPYDLLAIPRIGSLLMLWGTEPSVGVGYFVPDSMELGSAHLRALHQHAMRLLGQCRPILKSYPDAMALEFDQAITRVEEKDGPSYLLMDGLATVTTPREVDEARAWPIILQRQGQESARQIRAYLESRDERRRSFLTNLERCENFDICPKRAVERLGPDGYLPWDDWLHPYGGKPPSHRQIAEQMDYLLELLSHPNYHLALVDDEALHQLGVTYLDETYWLVKSGNALMMEVLRRDQEGNEVAIGLKVTDPILIDLYASDFLSMWKSVYSNHDSKVRTIKLVSDKRDYHRSLSEREGQT